MYLDVVCLSIEINTLCEYLHAVQHKKYFPNRYNNLLPGHVSGSETPCWPCPLPVPVPVCVPGGLCGCFGGQGGASLAPGGPFLGLRQRRRRTETWFSAVSSLSQLGGYQFHCCHCTQSPGNHCSPTWPA